MLIFFAAQGAMQLSSHAAEIAATLPSEGVPDTELMSGNWPLVP
jgi:hypothetical protein